MAFNCSCILVSSHWKWPVYWPKHVGEYIISKNTTYSESAVVSCSYTLQF